MKNLKVWQLVLLLVVVIGGSVFFVGLSSGWFSSVNVKFSPEYLCGENCDGEFLDLTPEEYEKLVAEKKSFMVFVDQGGCTTADRLRGFVKDYASSAGIRVYRIDFSDMKETSLHESVKYYPSVALVSSGKVVGFLRADSDEDSDAYNKYEAFLDWMGKYVK